MNFELTNDQKMLRDEVRKFAENELAPLAPEIDISGEFPKESIKKLEKSRETGEEIKKWDTVTNPHKNILHNYEYHLHNSTIIFIKSYISTCLYF